MGLHPGIVRRAILLRAMPVLETLPDADLAGTSALILTGARDPFGQEAPRLETWLRDQGADVAAHSIDAGHELSSADLSAARHWYEENSEGGRNG